MKRYIGSIFLMSLLITVGAVTAETGAQELPPNAGFESGTFDGWQLTGDAFGSTPTTVEFRDIPDVKGLEGKYFANSFHGLDAGTGTLTSQPFKIEQNIISFLIAGGHRPYRTCVNLIVNNRPVRTATGHNSVTFKRIIWDVSDLEGQKASIEIVDNSKAGFGFVMFDDLRFGIPEFEKIDLPADFYKLDMENKQYAMLIGLGNRGTYDGGVSYRADYGMDHYAPFEKLFAPDGFNSFAFVLNTGHGASVVDWDTKVDGWGKNREGFIELNLRAAEESGIVPLAEFLTAATANVTVLEQHPEWAARTKEGAPQHYMGPLVCSNSPYWKESLMPLYTELFTKYGDRLGGIVLWEGPGLWCWSDLCKQKFKESGMSDYRAWKRVDKLEKYGDIARAIRASGWKGKIIGGGWAAYEWEEDMWDSTIAGREILHYNHPELEAFKNGFIDMIMPELYTHSTLGACPYRRTDAHSIYRSLMYERSVFGENIIPNVELFWPPRSMTPDEVFRWLLEVWSAGYDDYSIVSEEKLYVEHYAPEQDEYRLIYRNIFREFNNTPHLGKPWPNFQFLVSVDLEKSLFYSEEAVEGYKNPWDWYVKETNRLFKNVDRQLCGGAVVNEKVTDLDHDDLYGIVSDELPRFMMIPEGCPEPNVGSATNVLKIKVNVGEDLEAYAPQIAEFIGKNLTHRVGTKSPLVYVNWNKTKEGVNHISVINHADEDGIAEIKLKSSDVEVVIDSERVFGKRVRYRIEDGWLKVDLAPYAAIVFREL